MCWRYGWAESEAGRHAHIPWRIGAFLRQRLSTVDCLICPLISPCHLLFLLVVYFWASNFWAHLSTLSKDQFTPRRADYSDPISGRRRVLLPTSSTQLAIHFQVNTAVCSDQCLSIVLSNSLAPILQRSASGSSETNPGITCVLAFELSNVLSNHLFCFGTHRPALFFLSLPVARVLHFTHTKQLGSRPELLLYIRRQTKATSHSFRSSPYYSPCAHHQRFLPDRHTDN